MSPVRRYGYGHDRRPCDARARRIEGDRRRGRGSVEQPDVVAHDRRVPGDGRAYRRAVQRADACRARHRLRRTGRKETYPLQSQKFQSGGRARFHLLQRRLYGRECARQSDRREGHEARGEVPASGRLSGLRRHATLRRGPGAAASRHRAGRGVPHDARGVRRVGVRRPRFAAGGDAPHGREHLRVVPRRFAPSAGLGVGIPRARSGGFDPIHRRAANPCLAARRNVFVWRPRSVPVWWA
mgnify:CR=1 FL=1